MLSVCCCHLADRLTDCTSPLRRQVADDEVCGCPLVADVFTNMGQFCRAPKKKCLKHFSWEKLRRAELDMERVCRLGSGKVS